MGMVVLANITAANSTPQANQLTQHKLLNISAVALVSWLSNKNGKSALKSTAT